MWSIVWSITGSCWLESFCCFEVRASAVHNSLAEEARPFLATLAKSAGAMVPQTQEETTTFAISCR
jgi:hypothetical protein